MYKVLCEEFLAALFLKAEVHIPGRTITGFMVKHVGLVIPDSTLKPQGNWTTLCVVIGHLVAALWGRVKFRSRDHAQPLNGSHTEIRRWKAHDAGEYLSAAAERLSRMEVRRLRHVHKTGVWLPAAPSMMNRMDLGAQELSDELFLICGIKPPDLPRHCNGCSVG